MEQLPIIGGTALGTAGLVIALVRWLVFTEIKVLRDQQADLLKQVGKLEILYDEQRREKHRLANELTKAQVLLGVIIDLAEQCTCGALDLVKDLMSRALDRDVLFGTTTKET